MREDAFILKALRAKILKRACILKASFWETALRRDVRRELLYTSCSAGSAGCISFRPCFLHENSSQTLLIHSQFLAAVFGR